MCATRKWAHILSSLTSNRTQRKGKFCSNKNATSYDTQSGVYGRFGSTAPKKEWTPAVTHEGLELVQYAYFFLRHCCHETFHRRDDCTLSINLSRRESDAAGSLWELFGNARFANSEGESLLGPLSIGHCRASRRT